MHIETKGENLNKIELLFELIHFIYKTYDFIYKSNILTNKSNVMHIKWFFTKCLLQIQAMFF